MFCWNLCPFKSYINFTKNNFSDPSDKYLEDMMNEAPGPINFTMFLTMFGEKLNGTDPEDVIRNAFACFDDDNTGNNASFIGNSNRAYKIKSKLRLQATTSYMFYWNFESFRHQN